MSRVPHVSMRPPLPETPPATPQDQSVQPERNILLTLGGPIPFRGGRRKSALIRWFPAILFALSLPPLTILLLWLIPQPEWSDSLPLVVLLSATALAHSAVLLVRFAQGFLDVGKPASENADHDPADQSAEGFPGPAVPARDRSPGDRYRVSLSGIGNAYGISTGDRIRRSLMPSLSADERRRTIHWSGYEHIAHLIYLVGAIALLALEAVHHV